MGKPHKIGLLYCIIFTPASFGPQKIRQCNLNFREPGSVCRQRNGKLFLSYDCAISPESEKRIIEEIRETNFQRWTGSTLETIARVFAPKLRGWLGYYGELERLRIRRIFERFNFRPAGTVDDRREGL